MSDVQTKNILPELKDRGFLQYIQQEIIVILKKRPLTLFQLLKKLDNCDPLVANKAVENLKALKLVKFNNRSKEYYCKSFLAPTFPENRIDIFSKFKNKLDLTSSLPNIHHCVSLVKNIKGCLPEASPAFFQWWFSDSTYSLLSNAILSRTNCRSRLAFIGAPTLGAYLSKLCKNSISIFDIDKYVLEAMRNHGNKNADFIQYDVFNEIGISFKNKFHLVYLDPPWYLEPMLLFLKRALEICKNGSYIFISLPPLNTRATALSERNKILEFVTHSGLEVISYWPSKIEYEIPKFERNTYAHSGITLDFPWRKGDLLLLKKSRHRKSRDPTLMLSRQESWEEVDIGKCRFFFRDKSDYGNANPAILKLPNYHNFYLKSTSLRESGRRKANMISSRNHGALVRGGKILYEIFETLSSRKNIEDSKKQLVRKYGRCKKHIEKTVDTISAFLRE